MSSASLFPPDSWRKSTYSTDNGGACLEVADGYPGLVPVRDSKNPTAPALLVPTHAWQAFIGHLREN